VIRDVKTIMTVLFLVSLGGAIPSMKFALLSFVLNALSMNNVLTRYSLCASLELIPLEFVQSVVLLMMNVVSLETSLCAMYGTPALLASVLAISPTAEKIRIVRIMNCPLAIIATPPLRVS